LSWGFFFNLFFMRLCLLFAFFLSFAPSSFAGNGDTLQLPKAKNSITYFYLNQFEKSDRLNFVDNSLYNFQNSVPRSNLGNIGLAFNDFIYQPFLPDLGFRYYKNNFQRYFYSPFNLAFYNTKSPYTDLFYQLGTQKEQDFKGTFSYNIKENWNVTVNYFHIRSKGFYPQQTTNDNFISASSYYRSKNNRYHLLVGVMFNSVKNQENGGVVSDSVFESHLCDSKNILPVNLSSANIFSLNENILVDQYFYFGEMLKDSLAEKLVNPSARLKLSTSYENNTLKYTDEEPLSGFYSNVYFDTVSTHDKSSNLKIENELSWKRLDNRKHRGLIDQVGFGGSLKHQFVQVQQINFNTTFNNVILGAELFNTYSNNRLFYNLSGQYAVAGYNNKDYLIDASLKKAMRDSLTFLEFGATSRLQTPDFIFQRYASNNFIWNNNFDQIKETSFRLNYVMQRYKLATSVIFTQYTNVVYFNQVALPAQDRNKIPVVHFLLKKDFSLYNWHWNNTLNYQYVAQTSVIRLPAFIYESSLYYENSLFAKAMRAQIGVFLYYNSSFYSNAYMPATTQFYIQTEKKFGNYPFFDFFLNVKVKDVRIFVKVDHLNYCFTHADFSLTPLYPMNDRVFKLGISWRFYD
jgi:hypothetical protein